ncbi:MAG: hypothetical protein IPL53_11725 [Ignavibacteria bacterium]|nr:hypothetical protein [Ignavibacteria bacterium]
MKTCNVIFITVLIFMLSVPVIFSQSGYKKDYITDDILIDYSDDSLEIINSVTGIRTLIPASDNLNSIGIVRVINDSLISVSGDNISNAMLNINKINSISISNGSYTGIGVGLGALAGLGIGILIVSGTDLEQSEDPVTNLVLAPANMGLNLLWGLLSTVSGAVIGGVIGGNISSYDKYYLDEHNINKRREIEKILKLNSKLNAYTKK